MLTEPSLLTRVCSQSPLIYASGCSMLLLRLVYAARATLILILDVMYIKDIFIFVALN